MSTVGSRVNPSDFVFVIMDMGQSNAIGRAESDRLALTTYPERPANIVMFFKPDYTTTANGDFEAYQAGVNTEEPDASASLRLYSHSLVIANKLRDITGNRCYIIPAGDGGTALEQNLTSPDWYEGSTAECFDIFLNRFFDVAMPSIIATHPTKQIKVVVVWAQGETDATDGTATADYDTNFASFYAAVRAHGTYSSYLTAAPWIIPTLNYMQTAGETTINTDFTNFAAGTGSGRVFVVDMSAQKRKQDLTTGEKGGFTPTATDDEHLSYLAQNYLGEQAAEIIRTYYGLPAFPSEVTSNTAFDPSTITASGVRLQFSRNENTIDSDNKITNANNSLTSTDFTTVATAQHAPRFKVDKTKGAVWFSPLSTVHRIESDAALGTSLFAGSWSCAFWTKPRNPIASTTQTIFHDVQNTASPNNSRIQVAILDGKVYGIVAVGGTAIQFKTAAVVTGTGSTDWTNGEDVFDWVHVAITVTSGDFVRVYINGILVANDANPTFNGDLSGLTLANYVNVTNKLQVGARRSGASTYDLFYYGMLRELVIQPGVVYNTTDIANLMLN